MTAPVAALAVSGLSGALGEALLARLGAPGNAFAVGRVVGIDQAPPPTTLPAGVEHHRADLTTDDLEPLLEGCDALVHLAFTSSAELGEGRAGPGNLLATRRLLAAAGAAGVGHVVLVSSATVYGAWPNNPVPITEDAPLRPNPELSYAVQKAEIERVGAEFQREHPGATVTVLRPAVALGRASDTWLASSVRASLAIRAGSEEPPAQFLHLDDLASAIEVAVEKRLDGPYNVAPEGWIEGDGVRALAGTPRVPVPAWLARRVAALTWRLRLGSLPPGLLAYTMHPWVVASDRLQAAGWAPEHSNEEAFVAGHEGSFWARQSPKRRQELALGGAVLGLAGLAAAALTLVRRSRRVRGRRGVRRG